SLEEALAAQPEAVLITNPALLHIETALTMARQGTHLFIEKPLSNTLDGIDELMELCSRSSRVLMVGYNFRFYEPLQKIQAVLSAGEIGRILSIQARVGQYLPNWRSNKDYRQGVSARKELGGGVVLELSHELDYVRWLVGEVKAVSAQAGHLSDLEIDVEDTAEIILEFENGAFGSIHMDMVDRAATRTCRIVGTDGTLTWDGPTHEVRIYSAARDAWSELHPASKIDPNTMYLAELQHFFECIREKRMPVISAADGRRVLEIALAVRQSAQERRTISL
ncbi:MAG TPA: Gfo/Idh/MocA family oxidoreductase, partial [Anaerolineae bacterium]|nr:Gfo/Idh/MocA family oxidoreductase [Anaerolineae bacterium]